LSQGDQYLAEGSPLANVGEY